MVISIIPKLIRRNDKSKIKKKKLTFTFMSNLLHKTSISNFKCNFMSGSLWSSAMTFMMAIVHGLGGLNTRDLAQDSITLATKGTTCCISCIKAIKKNTPIAKLFTFVKEKITSTINRVWRDFSLYIYLNAFRSREKTT